MLNYTLALCKLYQTARAHKFSWWRRDSMRIPGSTPTLTMFVHIYMYSVPLISKLRVNSSKHAERTGMYTPIYIYSQDFVKSCRSFYAKYYVTSLIKYKIYILYYIIFVVWISQIIDVLHNIMDTYLYQYISIVQWSA